VTVVRLNRMSPADAPAVRRLERRCFGGNVGPPGMLHCFLDNPACAGLVALDARGHIVGYLLLHFDAAGPEVRVCQVAVHPTHRRRGVGSRLLRWVIDHTPTEEGIDVCAGVNESNLAAQLFLRSNRFRAVRVLPRAACGGTEDLYLFRFPS
jgi:ribosomal-protein-alanine N-acetyltransferase